MAEIVLSGQELADKINHEWWFYNPQDDNSLVSDAKFQDGILSIIWAGFSEGHESSYQFSRALDHGGGRISVFAIASFQRLDQHGFSRVNKEYQVLALFDHRHFPDLAAQPPPRR